MELKRIVAATDESEAGRQAVRAAVELGARTGAQVTVMRAVGAFHAVPAGIPPDESAADEASVERLRHLVEADLASLAYTSTLSFAVTHGLPGVEISRFAEGERADLLVLGRKPRSLKARLVAGDTADAVARRSLLPCLFVPGAGALPRRLLVAVDGSHRGRLVLKTAKDFARQIGADLHVVNVEPRRQQEPPSLAAAVPAARSLQLGAQVRATLEQDLEVRHGNVVEQILASIDERRPDALVIGYHRGGPPGIIDAGSTARRLTHTAPCATLTVPL
jgi:nucleotide-binding universal stress UspA family protein